ncbi:hypothetical protein SDRG_05297 [Saprolegnia diclina VS20]|uniref:Uncharacterized protein n=1 Tax=Saprolegnia diclina (strain VS20) TaxID=1156394 RepID=T0QSU0_SAPDV|nr:hypothetical protein SDRG_05297 [Saprolegnia diclina VS20]EQC37070.1 hypothetical protein SDRG_05297 [Saprolegnia diclina VS20]|eukprot:XP_008609232.1 hypothetical protein SDRG_05297 [Saprolegnia diclina VS20]
MLPTTTSGRSLLNEALSPTGRRVLNDFFQANAGAKDTTKPRGIDLQSLPLLTEVFVKSRAALDVLQLRADRHDIILVTNVLQKKADAVDVLDLRNMGLIRRDDVLVSINTEPVPDVAAAYTALKELPLPITLVFSRSLVRKNTLGEYSVEDVMRHVEHNQSRLLEKYDAHDAAVMLSMMVRFTGLQGSYTLLREFIMDAENLLMPKPFAVLPPNAFDVVRQYVQVIHEYMGSEDDARKKRWYDDKSSRSRRIESMQKQLKVLDAKLDATTSALAASPELQATRGGADYAELRNLVENLRADVERSKQMHYLPSVEGFTLRFGTGGVYVGVGDVWMASYQTSFSIETQRAAPHVVLRLTPLSDTGLQIRATNFKVYSEGRIPTFHCDELNIEALFTASIPLVFDDLTGWRVDKNDLDVSFNSLKYYERQANSSVRGKANDSVLKLFLNRVLPSVVEEAAVNFFSSEMGVLFKEGRAKVRLTGDLRLEGRPLSVFDASLSATDDAHADEARTLLSLTPAQGEALYKLYKVFVLTPAATLKQKIFSSDAALSYLSMRELIEYVQRLRRQPNVRYLLAACWQTALRLLSPSDEVDFLSLLESVGEIESYPVDVSLGLHSTNIRVDLCEGAAAAYASIERQLRQKLSSRPEMKTQIEAEITTLEEGYNSVNLLLSKVASRVDEVALLLSGGLPAGFDSDLSFEATEVTCKGPWQATVPVPLTDPEEAFEARVTAPTRTVVKADDGDLIVSQFVAGDDGEHEIQVRVQDAAFQVLVQAPDNGEGSASSSSFVPLTLALNTASPTPTLSLEMGDNTKCAIQLKRLAFCSPMWPVLRYLHAEALGAAISGKSDLLLAYVSSPFFAFSLRFFTSLQVTPEHMYWTLNSASLSESNVSFITHRICLAQLLRDLGALEWGQVHGGETDEDVNRKAKARAASRMAPLKRHDSIQPSRNKKRSLKSQKSFLGDEDPRAQNMFQVAPDGASLPPVHEEEPTALESVEDDPYYF